jgi:predicted kinase
VSRTRLFVICGLPGSGKTTLAKQLEATHDAVRFCPDECLDDLWDVEARAQLEATMWEEAQRLLAQGRNVVIEFGSWAREERDVLREGARALGASVELRYLEVPMEDLWRRIEARNQLPGETTMTRAHLEEWSTLIQVPTPTELALFDPRLP